MRGDARLVGGISADTRLLVVERRDLPALDVVLKRFPDSSLAPCVTREAEALELLEGAELPYALARVMGRDDTGRECDVPALLTTRVPGRIELEPRGCEARVRALGEALAAFHALQLPCPTSLRADAARRTAPIPNDPSLPDWAEVWRVVEQQDFRGTALCHGDFHIGNALFEGDRLTGIVDWASVRRGLPELDVAYCRLDLSMVLGGDAPAVFLAAYEARAGIKLANVSRWDLGASVRAFPDPDSWLAGWLDAGRDDLNPTVIRARLRDFVQNALRSF